MNKETKSPALDLAMKLMFDYPNEIIDEKIITIKITNRRSFVDYGVTKCCSFAT